MLTTKANPGKPGDAKPRGYSSIIERLLPCSSGYPNSMNHYLDKTRLQDLFAFRRRGVAAAATSLLALSLLSSACDSGGETLAPVEPSPITLQLSASLLELATGQSARLSVLQKSGTVNSVLTQGVTWKSSDPSVVTVDARGLVTGQRTGEASVTAASRAGTSSARIRVKPSSKEIDISPKTATLSSAGETIQLSASVSNKNGQSAGNGGVSWVTLDPGVASVSDSGLATALANGTARIVGTANGAADTATISVTISAPSIAGVNITPGNATLGTGQQAQFVATAVDARGLPVSGISFVWRSNDTTVAKVNGAGVVSSLGQGAATITASAVNASVSGTTSPVGINASMMSSGTASASASVTVRESASNATVSSLVLSPAADTVFALGDTARLSAAVRDAQGTPISGASVAWMSLNSNIATVDPMGNVIAKTVGAALIVATSGSAADTAEVRVQQLVSAVSVTPSSSSVESGKSVQLAATARDANGNAVPGQTFAWSSANSGIASVDATGLAKGVGAGSVVISAKSGQAVGNASLQVLAATTTEPPRTTTSGSPAELPRVSVDTRFVAPTGQTINVPAAGDLQKALNAAQPGDEILLAAGASFTGNFVLPKKSGSGWIIVRSGTALPAEGTRVTPATAANFAKIVSPNSMGALATEAGASGYRIMGVEITYAAGVSTGNTLVALGTAGSAQNTLASVPSRLIIDRSYIHGHDGVGFQRCVGLNSAMSAVIDSWLAECHHKGFDSQAIGGWNGPGPFKIVNNFLEGAGENIMFGGSDAQLAELIPADIEIRRNHLYKDPEWFSSGRWSVKNLFEIKTAVRVLVEGNVMENNWADAQTGFAVLLKSVNQGGGFGDFSRANDITIRYNIIRNSPGGLNLHANPEGTVAEKLSRVYVGQNLWEKMGKVSDYPMSGERMYQIQSDLKTIVVENNTATGSFQNQVIFEPSSTGRLDVRFVSNVVDAGVYGVSNAGSLGEFGTTFSNNVVGSATWNDSLPAGNCVTSVVLPVPSACAGAGVDRTALSAATQGVVIR